MDKPLKQARQRKVRVISGHLTNNGTVAIAAGAGFTVARSGVGDVTVTLSIPGRSILSVSAVAKNSTAATFHGVKVLSVTSASAVQFGTYVDDATDGAPADIDFYFDIKVKDASV